MNTQHTHNSDKGYIKGYLACKAGITYRKHASRAYKQGWWAAYTELHGSK